MTEDELVRRLRRGLPSPPPAPAGEWEAIASRIQGADGWAWLRRPAVALAAGLGVAALVVLPFIPGNRGAVAPDDPAADEEFLADAGTALRGAADEADEDALTYYF